MVARIAWDRYEVALLLETYEKAVSNGDFLSAAKDLSKILRDLATQRGFEIDEKYRNVNGIRMQLSNVWYLYTNGERGLSGASSLIRQMYELKKASPDDYHRILKEAHSLIGHPILAEAASIGSLSHETPEPIVRDVSSKQQDIFSLGIAEDILPLLEPGIVDSKYHIESEQSFEYIDLTTRSDCSFKNPVQVSYKDEVLKPVKTWKQVYIWVIQHLLRDYEETICGLISKPLTGRGLPDIRPREEANALRSVGWLSDDLVVEAGFSATDLMYRISLLMKSCGEKAITVAYIRRNKDGGIASNDQKTKPSQPVISGYDDKLLGFERFLSAEQSLADRTVANYIAAMHTIESYSLARGFSVLSASPENIQQIAKSLLNRPDFAEKNARRHNTYSAALGQYAHYLQMSLPVTDHPFQDKVATDGKTQTAWKPSSEANRIRELLAIRFSKGIRQDSRIDMGKFEGWWKEQYPCVAMPDMEEVKGEIHHICILHGGRYYLPECLVDEEAKIAILAKIDGIMSEDHPLIFYESLYGICADILEDQRIYNIDMFALWLQHTAADKYYLTGSYLAKDSCVKFDIASEMRQLMHTTGRPMSYQELRTHFKNVATDVFDSAWYQFEENGKVNGEWTRFDIAMVALASDEIEAIRSILDGGLNKQMFVTTSDLFAQMRLQLPDMVERYSAWTELGLRNAVFGQLGDSFVCHGNLVCRSGTEVTSRSVYDYFCETHSSFTLDQLYDFKNRTTYQISWDNVYARSFRVSKVLFVPLHEVTFDIDAVDEVLAYYCADDYVPLKKITVFSAFPYVGYPWNTFLLESFVYHFSRMFRIRNAGFTKDASASVIVRQSASFENIDEIRADALANSEILLNESNSLDFLAENGYIARRRLNEIDGIISQARLIRIMVPWNRTTNDNLMVNMV